MGWGGGGGAAVARGRRRHGGRRKELGSAAGALRNRVWRANAWRTCGVDGGSFPRLIISGCRALSRDRLRPFRPPRLPWASRSLEYMDQFNTAQETNNRSQVGHSI